MRRKPEVGDIWEYSAGNFKSKYLLLQEIRSEDGDLTFTAIDFKDGNKYNITFLALRMYLWKKLS